MRHINETVEQLGGELRRETLNGEEYLVAPVVAIQEGVYLYPRQNGRGIKRELLNSEEIEQSLPEWEGVPLTIPHPEDESGRPGLIINSQTTHTDVGKFLNVDVDSGALVGETWIRADAVGTVNGGLEAYIAAIERGEPQEVSTGYRANTDVSKGKYDDQLYTYTQSDLEPDHLALLPDERGNCSVEEGCGAGATVNQMPFAGDDGARVNNRLVTANVTPKQVDIVRDVAEQFVQSQGNANLAEMETWLRENETLGPDERTAVIAVIDELFGQDPGEWGVETEFLAWLDQRAGEDRENTLSDISDPSGMLAVSEGRSGSDTGGLLAEFLTRMNNLMAGKKPEGDSGTANADEDSKLMKNNIDRDTLIEEIVTNSEIKKESLDGMGDTCLEVTHDNIVNSASADGDGDGDGAGAPPEGDSDGDGDAVPESPESPQIEELAARVEDQEQVIEELKSERETERDELEEQVNRRLIANTELAEETVEQMNLEDKQNLAKDLDATADEPEQPTVNMNGIPDSGAAVDFEVDEEESEGSSIPAPGRANYDAFKEGEN